MIYLVFDESGDWGNSTERYYIIGGYITKDLSKVKAITRRAIYKSKSKFPSFLSHLNELKSSDCSPVVKDYLLRKISCDTLFFFEYNVITK
ncbi:hypothetical protein [Natranaerofaba carboxydovora]|uniref:hypothetical protein n=1 Tax=Natranaerofaba carboxydovora TaxID=2742683 RepID=UPI001F13D1F3|nr:hypothetical protein [Natranaerofaba carboxydovora]UMZ74975.1 hypothetical protein ACONDI_02581 [Natranaerofaba carboxydovora]